MEHTNDIRVHERCPTRPPNELDMLTFFYNCIYVQLVLNATTKGITTVKFISVSDLIVDGGRRIWDEEWRIVYSHRDNVYLKGTCAEEVKKNLAQDIINRGSYWVVTVHQVNGKWFVIEGGHRVAALQQYSPNYKILCVDLGEFGNDSWHIKMFPPNSFWENNFITETIIQTSSDYLTADNLEDAVTGILACGGGLQSRVHNNKDIIKPSPILNNEILFNSIVDAMNG